MSDFDDLPEGENWNEVKKYIPPQKPDTKLPKILISFEPAELILISGDPKLENIANTDIVYVTNTDSDLFIYENTYFYLVSGRWFKTEKLDGKWTPAENFLKSSVRFLQIIKKDMSLLLSREQQMPGPQA